METLYRQIAPHKLTEAQRTEKFKNGCELMNYLSGSNEPKCSECNQPLVFIEDEETGHQWWECHNLDCSKVYVCEANE